MVLYFGAIAAIAAVLHVTVAAFYFGTHMFGEMVFLPGMRKAKTNGELAVYQGIFKKLGPLFGGLGFGALLTGVLYLFAKFGTDFGLILASPEPRTIVAALVIFVGLITVATTVHRPIANWLNAQDLQSNPAEAPSAEVTARIEKFAKVSHGQTIGVVTVIVLMAIAANGGI